LPDISESLTELARAKINLWLRVTGRRPDGYHELSSLVAFASVGDYLSVHPSRAFSLTTTGRFAADLGAPSDNLILRAAQVLAEAEGVRAGAAFRLTKNLPVSSGIGGGSADAAAALRLCRTLWSLRTSTDAMRAVALQVGADVPVCLSSRTVHMTGIGEHLETPRLPLVATPAILVNPGVPISTSAVFREFEGKYSLPAAMSTGTDLITLIADNRNDLEGAARRLAPAIEAVLDAIAGTSGCHLARMSGSGATCFGLFSSDADAEQAAAGIATVYPDWWVAPCRIG